MRIGIYYDRPMKDIPVSELRDILVIRWGEGSESRFKVDAQRQIVCPSEGGVSFESVEVLVAEILGKVDSTMDFYYVDAQGAAFMAELIDTEVTSHIIVESVFIKEAKVEKPFFKFEPGKEEQVYCLGKKMPVKEIKIVLLCVASSLLLFLFISIILISKVGQLYYPTSGAYTGVIKPITAKRIVNGMTGPAGSNGQIGPVMPYTIPNFPKANEVVSVETVPTETVTEVVEEVEMIVETTEELELDAVSEGVTDKANIIINNYGTININP